MSGQDQDTEAQRAEIARRLKEAREYVGLSQEDVAAALGVARPAISLIEAGTRKVDSVELSKLSRLFGRPAQYFLTGEETVAGSASVEFLARTVSGLSQNDLNEVARFAEFLRRSPKPSSKGD